MSRKRALAQQPVSLVDACYDPGAPGRRRGNEGQAARERFCICRLPLNLAKRGHHRELAVTGNERQLRLSASPSWLMRLPLSAHCDAAQ